MSYTELEHGYQGLRRARPAFYIGVDGNGCPAVRAAKIRVSTFIHKLSLSYACGIYFSWGVMPEIKII
jgi:hypothetical protein